MPANDPAPAAAPLDLDDIQGNLLQPYGLPHARYVLLTVTDAARAQRWLRGLLPRVTRATPWGEKPHSTLNVGFTWQGLRALEVDPAALDSFPEDFRQGMAARAVQLGDLGESAPEHWQAPYRPPEEAQLHLVVVLHARTPEARRGAHEELHTATRPMGVRELGFQDTDRHQQPGSRPGVRRTVEHFGYTDGISDVRVEGSTRRARGGEEGMGPAVPAGAFLLGLPDVYGRVSTAPALAGLSRHGTYLVLRKLEQDVAGFRQFLAQHAGAMGGDPELLAAKLMGRWRSGAPLALAPRADDPALADSRGANNAFTYVGDPHGERCPLESHVRRANPRHEDRLSGRGVPGAHLLIRRGMTYGPPLVEGAAPDGKERGMLFAAYAASISDQFELVQREWLNGGNACGTASNVRDPIAGDNGEGSASTFTFATPLPPADAAAAPAAGPALGQRTLRGLPRFVTVRGGAYLFVPGMGGLRLIAREGMPVELTPSPAGMPATAPTPRGSFLDAYDALGALPPREADAQRVELLARSLLSSSSPASPGTADAWQEVRERRPIFSTPLGVFVTRFRDAQEVLGTSDVFSVREYHRRMALTSGAFVLGMDDTADYQREASLLRLAVRRQDGPPLQHRIRALAEQLLAQTRAAGRPVDVVALAHLALVRLAGEYFGVPGPNDASMLQPPLPAPGAPATPPWFQSMSAFIFQPFVSPALEEQAVRVALEANAYFDGLVASRRQLLERSPDEAPDDVLTRLLVLRDQQGGDLSDAFVRRTLAGTVSGTLVPTGMLFQGITQLLAREELREELAAAVEACGTPDDPRLTSLVLEAARFTPFPKMVYRQCTRDHLLARGLPHATPVPEGATVVVMLDSALRDAEQVERPERFEPDRPAWVYELLFGAGQHACLGKHLGVGLLTGLARALLPHVRPPEGPQRTEALAPLLPQPSPFEVRGAGRERD